MIQFEYQQRINKVIDFINKYPCENFKLEQLAEIAMFSKFHFHRIFKSITNENLNQYIRRVRLEKAYKQIINFPNKDLSEIAYENGFSSNANFSKAFRSYFGIPPSEARKKKIIPFQRDLNINKSYLLNFEEIKALPSYHVAYKRVTEGYKPDIIQKAYSELISWMQTKSISFDKSKLIGIGYSDPDFTPHNQCIYDACVTIPSELSSVDINAKIIEKGNYAIFRFEGKANDFHYAWDEMFKDWLINSKYFPDDKPHLEIYIPNEEKYKDGIFVANLCLPIV